MGGFLKDGVLLKELRLLTGLTGGKRATYVKLAELARMSPGMVSNYMTRFRAQGYVRRVGESNRTAYYELTEQGSVHRRRLLIDYNAELIRLYKTARNEIADRIEELLGHQSVRICLCPAGDTSEVVLSVLSGFPSVSVQAVLDDSPGKQSSGILGYPVLPFQRLAAMRVDGVVVATVTFGDRIEQRIREEAEIGVRIWTLF